MTFRLGAERGAGECVGPQCRGVDLTAGCGAGKPGVHSISVPDNDGNFDGYIAAVFAVDDFFAAVITPEIVNDFDVVIASDGRRLFESHLPTGSLEESLAYRGDLQLYGKEWALTLAPSRQFTARYRTWMPATMLGGGLLIGALLALLVRAVLVAKLRSTYLKASEETFRSAMESASIGMALVKLDGRFMKVNGALCTLLGIQRGGSTRQRFSVHHAPGRFAS